MNLLDIERIEAKLLVSAVRDRYGYDFTNYSEASLLRRIRQFRVAENVATISELIPLLLHDPAYLKKAIEHFSVTVTEMFRDPAVFLKLREEVVSLLASYSQINIWIAGCATGEEVYSMAILLEEEGILDRCQLYATDINDSNIKKAEEGIFSSEKIILFEENYLKSGGRGTFSDYYQSSYGFLKISDRLRKKVLFSYHNLVSDGVFCEMNLILCRNVLIYFNKTLQNRVFKLFSESLSRRGFLCIGTKEEIQHSTEENNFSIIDKNCKIYQKLMAI